jgi:hypothetical protein
MSRKARGRRTPDFASGKGAGFEADSAMSRNVLWYQSQLCELCGGAGSRGDRRRRETGKGDNQRACGKGTQELVFCDASAAARVHCTTLLVH